MHSQILIPKSKPLIIDGIVSYSETCRARSIIRLKKDVINEFNDLKNRDKLIRYKLEYYRGPRRLQKRVNEITENGGGIPFLLFIYSEENGDSK